MNKIHIETLGCRLNQIESEAAARFFTDQNFSVSMEGLTSSSESDNEILIGIINTCTVTQKAEQKARRLIRLMLKKYPSAVIIVTGCYAQLAAKEIEEIDKRICVIGGQMKSRIAKIPLLPQRRRRLQVSRHHPRRRRQRPARCGRIGRKIHGGHEGYLPCRNGKE